MEENLNKSKLNFNESIEFELVKLKIKTDLLEFIKVLINQIDDIKELSNVLVQSDSYSVIKNKFKSNPIFDKIKFDILFLKIAGDVVNHIMYINKIC